MATPHVPAASPAPKPATTLTLQQPSAPAAPATRPSSVKPAANVVVELPPDFELCLNSSAPGQPYYRLVGVSAGNVPSFQLNRLYNPRLQFVKSLHGFGEEEEATVADYVVKVPVSEANRAKFAPLFSRVKKASAQASGPSYVWVKGEAVLNATGLPLRKLTDFTPVLMQTAAGFYRVGLAYKDNVDAQRKQAISEPMMVRGPVGKVLVSQNPKQLAAFRKALQASFTQLITASPFLAPVDMSSSPRLNEVQYTRDQQPSLISGTPLYERAVYILDFETDSDRLYAYLDMSLVLATGRKGDYLEPDLNYSTQLASYQRALNTCYRNAVKKACDTMRGTFHEPPTCSCTLKP